MTLITDDCFSSPRRRYTKQYTHSTKPSSTITTCKLVLPRAERSCVTVGSSNCDFASPHTWWRWPSSPAFGEGRTQTFDTWYLVRIYTITRSRAAPLKRATRPEKHEGGIIMSRICLAALAVALSAVGFATTGLAQQAQRPQIETTKVDGTDNVYIFRKGNHQSMFIVTKDGVIAPDPIAYGRPTGGQDYIAEIKKVTDKPIKFLIYSHHHYDHIAGGKPFKDAGATIVAHRRARERLAVLKDPHTPLPDQTVNNNGRTINLGGTRLDLKYVGLNHSDSTLVMHLPKEKIIFVVDLLAVGSMPGRGLIDFYPLEAEDSIKRIMAMDWERLIPGHPG